MKEYRVAVLTMGDTGSERQRRDDSGLKIIDFVEEKGLKLVSYNVIPDEKETIYNILVELCDSGAVDLIFTTGGAGLSKKDVTPEVTRSVIEKEVPGISEAIRYCAIMKTSRGMFSRAVSGIRKDTLIINMPGNVKVVEEALDFIFDAVLHGLDVMDGSVEECERRYRNIG